MTGTGAKKLVAPEKPLHVLVVEDRPSDADLLAAELRRAGCGADLVVVDSPEQFQQELANADYDVILSDYNLTTWTAAEGLEILHKSGKDIPFILVTGTVGEERAVECMRQGATDYLLKDRLARLPSAVRRALDEKAERQRRERLEEQLRQSQKVEAIGQLAGGIAHDFNNLLSIILGYGQLALEDLRDQSPLRDQLEEIVRAGERAATLTRQLLAFGRRQVLAPQVIDLNDLITDMDKMLRRLLGEHIELVTSPREGLGSVKADPAQIEQLIMNLAVNARDAMPQGGRLTMETDNVELGEEYARHHLAVKSGPYVMLAVSDTGCGMDAETRQHIFEPFFTTKEKGKGTGLGLSTVYGIVKQSGGNIWVYSEPGKGTAFKVYFPRVEQMVQAETTVQDRPERGVGSETILLVEDEDEVRKMARGILESSGYKVFEAKHGEEAVGVYNQHWGGIHLLLTDLVMPKMGGRELVEGLGSALEGVKVLFMSGYTDNALMNNGMLGEGAAFLQKPFTPASLRRKVREVLDGKLK